MDKRGNRSKVEESSDQTELGLHYFPDFAYEIFFTSSPTSASPYALLLLSFTKDALCFQVQMGFHTNSNEPDYQGHKTRVPGLDVSW